MKSNVTMIESRNKSIFNGLVFQCIFQGDLRDDNSNLYYFHSLMHIGMNFKQWLYSSGLESYLKPNPNDETFAGIKQRVFDYSDMTDQIEQMLSVFYNQSTVGMNGLHIMITDKHGTVYKCTVKNTVLIANYKRKFLLCQLYVDSRIDPMSQEQFKLKP